MARVFTVWKHRELVTPRGDVIATGGQSIPADHPAIEQLVDIPSIGYFEERADAPAEKAMPAQHRPTISKPIEDLED
jgi:hypothetical protein